MTEPMPVRRRIPAKEELSPEAARLRRRYLVGGALLGIAIGAILALFVIPPIVGHYFGAADVAYGETYERDGRTIAVEQVDEYTAGNDGVRTIAIQLHVVPGGAWQPDIGGFRLHLADGLILQPNPPQEKMPSLWPDFAGAERPLDLTYFVPNGSAAAPDYLEVPGFNARFHLARPND